MNKMLRTFKMDITSSHMISIQETNSSIPVISLTN
jgi:hypothetical protein